MAANVDINSGPAKYLNKYTRQPHLYKARLPRQRTGIQAHSRRVSSLLVTLNLAGSSCKETFRFRNVMTLHHMSEASSYVSDKGTNIPFAWQIKKRKDEKRLNSPRSP